MKYILCITHYINKKSCLSQIKKNWPQFETNSSDSIRVLRVTDVHFASAYLIAPPHHRLTPGPTFGDTVFFSRLTNCSVV